MYYHNQLHNQEEPLDVKQRLSQKFLHVKAKAVTFTPTLQSLYLKLQIDIGWNIYGTMSPYNYRE